MKNLSFRNRIMLCLTLISIIPMIGMSTFYYFTTVKVTKKNLIGEAREGIEKVDKILSLKAQMVQKMASLIFADARIKGFVQLEDDADILRQKDSIDEILKQQLYNEKDIRGLIMFFGDNYYTYNCEIKKQSFADFAVRFGNPTKNMGKVTWFGEKNVFENDEPVFLIGESMYIPDTQMSVVSVYFAMENNFATDILVQSDSEKTTSVYSNLGELILRSKDSKYKSWWDYPFSMENNIFSDSLETNGSFRAKVNKDDTMFIYIKSKFTDWVIVQSIPYKKFAQEQTLVILNIALILIVIIISTFIATWVYTQSLYRPIKKLNSAMFRFSNGEYDVCIPLDKRNDEINSLYSGFNNMASKVWQLLQKISEEEEEKFEAQFKMLQYQINPHFLYNTLSAIRFSALSSKNPELANVILLTSKIFKNSITNVNKLVTVGEDMESLNDFIQILQFRHNNAIDVQYDIDTETLSCQTLAMLLQPIVENAVHHGISEKLSNKELAKIKISTVLKENQLIMEVWDNGCGITQIQIDSILDDKKDLKTASIGINNIKKRIKLQFGEEYGVKIESKKGEYTAVTINIPKMKKRL